MRNYTLLVLLLICCRSTAQMVGGNVFLQGTYLEIGMNGTGAFGACSPPAGYHPHTPSTTALAEVYDYGHDGWTTGVPPFMGDYTEPGVPSEGWSVQIGPTEYRNWVYGGPCSGTTTIPGSVTGYSTLGGMIKGTWAGTAPGLSIEAESRVDINASAVVVTVKFTNTTSGPLGPIYYERMCDPDNTSSWTVPAFGTSLTSNVIEHQNEDATHKVVVSATGQVGGAYAGHTFMALGTKDCRAKGFYQSGYGLAPSTTPAAIYGGATGYTSILHDSMLNDIAIELVYSLGTLTAAGTPGDKTIISFAYFFNRSTGIDSAFPDPQLVVNGTPLDRSAPPVADFDTFKACDHPGVTILPVSLLYADDKCWSWSSWTWAGPGLSSTTGVTNTIDIAALPGVTTFTITGTDSAFGMYSCLNKTFYLTVIPCNQAFNNSPCFGDSLKFNMKGDSTGATYVWYGPAPSTTVFSTLQNPFIYPATYADAGLYHVVRTVLGVPYIDSTVVVIHEKPVLTASSNIPLCAAVASNLNLTVSPGLPGGSYAWSGPNAFTSTDQNPTISPFALIDTGTYTVIGVSSYGCKDTATTFVYPGTTAAFTKDINLGCDADTVVFTNNSTNASNYTWNFGDGSAPVLTTTPASLTHRYTEHKQYTVTLTSKNDRCSNTFTDNVDTRHTVAADFEANNDTICVNVEPTTLVDLSSATVQGASGVISTWDWNFGDGSAHETTAGPTHTYTVPEIYPVTLTVTDSIGCPDAKTHYVVVIDPQLNGLTDTTACLLTPMQLNVSVTMKPNIVFNNYSYEWSPATGLSSSTDRAPFFTGFGDYTYTVTAIAQPFTACPTTHVVTIHSVLGAKLMNVTGNSTINYGDNIQLNSSNEIKYMWLPNDGSLNNNNINNPVATPTVTTTYTVYGMDKYGCVDSASLTVVVDSTMSEFVPSAFTPNGDGRNDKFFPTYLKFQKLVEFSVYNRWGQKVFSTSNKEDGWDGTFNGQPQDMGVYFYNIIISRAGYSTNQVYKGEVTLIR